jgi:hypothetical protein
VDNLHTLKLTIFKLVYCDLSFAYDFLITTNNANFHGLEDDEKRSQR